MSRDIKCAVIHFVNGFPGPDIHKDIKFINFDDEFIEVVMSANCSITYPTFNVIRIEQYSEKVD